MSSKKRTKRTHLSIDDYKEASRDVWSLFMSFFTPQDSEKFWKDLNDESNRVCEKWNESPLKEYVLEYVVLCMEDIARRYKNGN